MAGMKQRASVNPGCLDAVQEQRVELVLGLKLYEACGISREGWREVLYYLNESPRPSIMARVASTKFC